MDLSAFDEPVDRTGTDSVKWDVRKNVFGREDILPMWVADMDFRVHKEILDAMHRRLDDEVLGYTVRPERYEKAIADWLADRHGWEVSTDHLRYIPGVMPGVSFAIQAFSKPGDRVIIQPPVYPPFIKVLEANERKIGHNQLVQKNGRYEIDFDDLEAQLKADDTKILLLCSPHNPVGRVWEQKELERIGELCLEHDVLIVSDDIHYDIVYGGHEHIPIASLSSELQEQTVTVSSPGKTFNIQGLLSAFAAIPNDKLRAAYDKVLERNWIHLENVMSITGCEAAFRYGQGWVDKLVEYLQYNRNYMMDHVRERIPGIDIIEPEGTYIAWLDCRELGMEGDELKDFMINEARVGLNDGRTFGPGGEGFMRINFGCPRKTLEEGLERIETAVKQK